MVWSRVWDPFLVAPQKLPWQQGRQESVPPQIGKSFRRSGQEGAHGSELMHCRGSVFGVKGISASLCSCHVALLCSKSANSVCVTSTLCFPSCSELNEDLNLASSMQFKIGWLDWRRTLWQYRLWRCQTKRQSGKNDGHCLYLNMVKTRQHKKSFRSRQRAAPLRPRAKTVAAPSFNYSFLYMFYSSPSDYVIPCNLTQSCFCWHLPHLFFKWIAFGSTNCYCF